MKNAIEFDFADNPDLKAVFQGWTIGESHELTIKFQLNEMTDVGAKGTLEDIEVPAGEGETEAEEVKATADEPVMVLIAAGRGKSSPKE
jgi:hypothetical protein